MMYQDGYAWICDDCGYVDYSTEKPEYCANPYALIGQCDSRSFSQGEFYTAGEKEILVRCRIHRENTLNP